jgi:hypothetical protein
VVRIDYYGCIVDRALVSRMRRHERIVRVGGPYGQGMVLISWVMEVDYFGCRPCS